MEQQNTLKGTRGPAPTYTPDQAKEAYDLHVTQGKSALDASEIMRVKYWMIPRMAAAHKRTLEAK